MFHYNPLERNWTLDGSVESWMLYLPVCLVDRVRSSLRLWSTFRSVGRSGKPWKHQVHHWVAALSKITMFLFIYLCIYTTFIQNKKEMITDHSGCEEAHFIPSFFRNENGSFEISFQRELAGSFSADPTDTLLLQFEFEARAKLNDPKVETVLESVLELDSVETKLLENIAGKTKQRFLSCLKKQKYSWRFIMLPFSLYVALAMEPPAHFPLLCKKALRVALSLHKKQPQADLARCRHTQHHSARTHPRRFL